MFHGPRYALVSGLGYGTMSAIFMYLNILSEASGPGTFYREYWQLQNSGIICFYVHYKLKANGDGHTVNTETIRYIRYSTLPPHLQCKAAPLCPSFCLELCRRVLWQGFMSAGACCVVTLSLRKTGHCLLLYLLVTWLVVNRVCAIKTTGFTFCGLRIIIILYKYTCL